MKKLHTPLMDRLIEHYDRQVFSFHVPGHKYGELWSDDRFKKDLLQLDATELSGLDDLHDPSGVIKEAQDQTARFYQADRSYFLVNGTTVGNLAMILATCRKGSTVLVQRNCHKSIMNGIRLAEAIPVFLTPEVDVTTGVATGITIESVEEAFKLYDAIDAVILTNPNYYGMTQDLTGIIAFSHEQGCPVLVDEAHGAHFGIGSPFPSSSLSMGADVVVQSAHKTLPAMTMASFLHIKSSLVDPLELEDKLEVLQSSSPSYVLMASLDYARAYLESLEPDDIKQIIVSIQELKERLKTVPQIEVVQGSHGCDYHDPLKLVVQSRTKLSGYELQKVLEQVGIYTELADPFNVLFVLPLSRLKQKDHLINLIKATLSSYEVVNDRKPMHVNYKLPAIAEIDLSRSNQQEQTKVPLAETVGKVSAETIIPYPPGIPILLKGERITKDHLAYCSFLIEQKARFQGNQPDQGIMIYR
ncbi:aminotransferase class I/II-fold pyridoxal phosphate-dependent enzyme [Pseudalkalibacillus sp. Hm43]|uniref:aminotransferase class I/II-fold pyridoxal phosphate-dependent enzyme n=1 Tax=Pseudalkalibacillus sp. Hm43 TaxID=3450742 RepID=UPI003F41EE52